MHATLNLARAQGVIRNLPEFSMSPEQEAVNVAKASLPIRNHLLTPSLGVVLALTLLPCGITHAQGHDSRKELWAELRAADSVALRDALKLHKHEAGDLWHGFLAAEATNLCGPGSAEIPDLATRVADALDQLLCTQAFTEDLIPLRHMPLAIRAQRSRLLAELEEARAKERAAHATEDAPTIASSTVEVKAALAACDSLARTYADRELLRHLALTEVARVRMCSPTDWKLRTQTIEQCISHFQHDDLLHDGRTWLLQLESASLRLRLGELSSADRLLGKLAHITDLPPFARAQLASMRAVTSERCGLLTEAHSYIEQLSELLPLLRALELDADSQSLLAEWHLQVASKLVRDQHVAAALECINALPEGNTARAGIRTKLALLKCRATMKLGRSLMARHAAGSALRNSGRIQSGSPEASEKSSLEYEALTLLALAELRLEHYVTARATLNAESVAEPAPLSNALLAERQLVLAHIFASEGQVLEALAAVDDAAARSSPRELADIHLEALNVKSNLLAKAGEEQEAVLAAEQALTTSLRTRGVTDPQALEARLHLVALLVEFDRLADAAHQLSLVTGPVPPTQPSNLSTWVRSIRLRAEVTWRSLPPLQNPSQVLLATQRELHEALDRLVAERLDSGPEEPATRIMDVLRGYGLLQDIALQTTHGKPTVDLVELALASLDKARVESPSAMRGATEQEALARIEVMRAKTHESQGATMEALACWRKAAAYEQPLQHRRDMVSQFRLSLRFDEIHERIAALLLARACREPRVGAVHEALLALDKVRSRSAHAPCPLRARPGVPWSRAIDDWADARKLLPPGRVVVAHAVTAGGTFVLACSQEQAVCMRLAISRPELLRRLARWRSAMQLGPRSAEATTLAEEGHALWKTLIDPVAHVVANARELCFLTPPELTDAPFAALLVHPFAVAENESDWSRAPFVIARPSIESIVAIPCLSALNSDSARKADAAQEGSVLFIGDPESDLPPLLGARAEGETLSRLFGPRTRRLQGKAAQREPVLQGLRGKPEIIHFACHALPGERGGAELVLAESRSGAARLRADDVRKLNFSSSPLVVLAACRSADSRARNEAFDLPSAFLAAGARCVVGPCLAVSDDDSLKLLTAFYEDLRAHPESSASAALSKAQRSFAREARQSSPRHWAPWIATGQP
jgi:CHAT domain-containing protein/tetratricopeptide (TPR) repeat protein